MKIIKAPGDDQSANEKDIEAFATDLVLYREGVETLMRLKSSSLISNSESAHAAILFEIFFRNAQEHVRIFCTKLSAAVFNNPSLVDAAKWALRKGRKISVVHQDDQPEESEFLSELREAHSVVVQGCDGARTLAYNFAVMDEQAYRMESDRLKWEGQAVMYAPEYSRKLVRKFDQFVMLTSLRHRGSGSFVEGPAAI